MTYNPPKTLQSYQCLATTHMTCNLLHGNPHMTCNHPHYLQPSTWLATRLATTLMNCNPPHDLQPPMTCNPTLLAASHITYNPPHDLQPPTATWLTTTRTLHMTCNHPPDLQPPTPHDLQPPIWLATLHMTCNYPHDLQLSTWLATIDKTCHHPHDLQPCTHLHVEGWRGWWTIKFTFIWILYEAAQCHKRTFSHRNWWEFVEWNFKLYLLGEFSLNRAENLTGWKQKGS
jgi:hypothetical protein